MESPVRPARRAMRKPLIVEESEDELSLVVEERDGEEFTPAPRRTSPRKSTRRQTTANVDISPKKSVRARKVKTGEAIEPSQIFEPGEPMAIDELQGSPTKKASPRKRTSVVPAKKNRRSSAAPEMSQYPTPDRSASPEPKQRQSPQNGPPPHKSRDSNVELSCELKLKSCPVSSYWLGSQTRKGVNR